MTFRWAFLSGIEANSTGTGRFMQHLQASVLARGRIDGTIVYSPKGQALGDGAMALLAQIPHLVMFHPQMLGTRQALALMQRRAGEGRVTYLYMLDSVFFCRRSYNHLDSETAPCFRCLGDGQWTQAARHGCAPWPADDPHATDFIAALHALVCAGRVHLLAQTAKQQELARRHFGDGATISYAGLWCADWTPYVEAFCAANAEAKTPSGDYDVVYHGSRDAAKGIGWVLAVAALTPELRYLVPIDRGAVNVSAPTNVTVAAMRWESGLEAAVRSAKLALAPSLWSSPCEGALIKSILLARATGVVDNASAFSSEIPGDVILKLPPEPKAAASALRDALAKKWCPDGPARRQWVEDFRSRNEDVASRLLPA